MSISNLNNQSINTMVIPCTLSGILTGAASIHFRRIDNIVFMSLIAVTGTATTGTTLTITPNVAIPAQYQPVGAIFRIVYVSNNSAQSLGIMSPANTLNPISITLYGGGNFTGTSGILDTTVEWRVPSQ